MVVKVSVLVPCYNVEKYIKQCLDSIVCQTLRDIEIICINDGSTDSTLSILRQYERQDARVKVITKENSGYGASMNIGLNEAQGEFIGIVESDDFAELDMFEILYNEAKKNNLDIVRSNFYTHSETEKSDRKFDQSWMKHNVVYAPVDDYKTFLQQPSVWSNLYRKSFLYENDIKFLETPGASYQDVAFTFKVYASAKSFKMIDNYFIHYRVDNANSSVNSVKKVFCICDEYEEIEKYVNKVHKSDIFKYIIPRMKYDSYSWNYNRLSPDLKFRFLRRMSREFRKYLLKGKLKRSFYSKRQLLKIIVISFFPIMYHCYKKNR